MSERPKTSSKRSPTKEELHRSAWQKLKHEDLGSAVHICQYLNSTFPDYPDGWHISSHVALKLGNARKAKSYIEKALYNRLIQFGKFKWLSASNLLGNFQAP